jgi:hypothetical protein
MTHHQLQFLRTATWNIDPAAQVTRLKCRSETFSEGEITDVLPMFGRIFAIQVLVLKYP